MASQNTLIYGKDETNTTRVLKCDDAGYLQIGTSANIGSTISIADYNTPANTLKVEADGSINVNGGGGGGGALQATLADNTVVAVEAVAGTAVDKYALTVSDVNNLYFDTTPPATNTGALLVYDLNGGGGGGALEATATDGTVVAVEAVAGTEAGKFSLATSDIKQTYTAQTNGASTRNFVNSYSKLVGNSATTVEHVALMDTAGRLQVNARISDTSGGGLASTSVGGIKALNVVDLNQQYTGTGTSASLNVNDTKQQYTGTGVNASLNVNDTKQLYYGTTEPTTNTGALLVYDLNGGGGGGALQATLADNTVVAVEAVAGTAVDKYALTVSDVNALYFDTAPPISNDGALLVYDLNGGGGGPLQATLADNTVVAVEAVAGTAVDKYALTVSDVNNLYFDTTPPSTNEGALLVYQVNSTSSTPLGSLNNVHSGSLAPGVSSTSLNINNTYGNESVLSYQDTSITAVGFVSIWGSLDDTNWFYIGALAPTVNIRSTLRLSVAVLKLAGLKYIRITSEETALTLSGISATLVSG
jgi:hypothetical protein